MTELKSLTRAQAALVLNGLPNIGPVTLGRLQEALGPDLASLLLASEESLRSVRGVGPVIARTLLHWRKEFDLSSEEERLRQVQGRFLARGDKGYPPLLEQMADGPIGLYQLGGYVIGDRNIAVVGSRRATSYGVGFTRDLVAGLVASGWCVVSGLALGIDAVAHEAALAAGGATVAVLGCGVDVVYPAQNRPLYGALRERGAILSEFPLGRRADRQTFAMRNRIVSGMCRAVVVVETDIDGGSMITARFAAEQGRLVFAVPGRVDLPQSQGCHELIRDGATLCRGAADVLSELECLPGFSLAERPLKQATTVVPAPPTLEGIPALLWPHLQGGAPLHPDRLTEQTGLGAADIAGALLWMEMCDLVVKRSDGCFCLR